MVLADSHRLPLIPWYLGVCSKELYRFRLQDYHLLWLNFPEHSTNNIVFYSSAYRQFSQSNSHNTVNARVAALNTLNGLDCFPFARHYSGNHFCFLFLRVLRCFSSPGCLLTAYVFSCRFSDITRNGLPHSEIHGY